MAKKMLIATLMATIMVFIQTGTSYASELSQEFKELKLKQVLSDYNSPLLGLESVLIHTAQAYELDWTLLAAIAGNESAFARRMPWQCTNPFGWGIYGDNKLCFESLEQSILGVGEGIGTKYNTTSVETIAYTYNPSNTKKWLSATRFFMNKIKNQDIPVSELPLEL